MQLKCFVLILLLTQGVCLKISSSESLKTYYPLGNNLRFEKADMSIFKVVTDTLQSVVKGDKDLVLSIVKDGTRKILRVSFNGKEGIAGVLKIYDVHNELIREINLELIKFPFYASLEVTEIGSGKYTIVLSTKQAKHTSLLTIK